jgi:alpha-glucuronidase
MATAFPPDTEVKNYDRMVEFTADDFLKFGFNVINRSIKSDAVAREWFQAIYGTEAVVVADVWFRLMNSQWREKDSMKPTHLLWSLMFLKTYGKQREMAPKNNCDEKTWRKWIWKGLRGINHLKKDFVSSDPVIVSDNVQSHSYCCCHCCC